MKADHLPSPARYPNASTPPTEDSSAEPGEEPGDGREQLIARHEPRNWSIMAAHLVLFRIGWVFKTESVIIPAFVDAISGAGWLRGSVPTLARLGQSIPPVLFSRRLKNMPRKKFAMFATMLLMALPILGLSVMWFANGGAAKAWMPVVFVLLYGLFSCCAGLNQISFGTAQGKLIRPTLRGRLFSVSTSIGVIPSVILAWWLMPEWLERGDGGFGLMFLFCGLLFMVAGTMTLGLFEPADDFHEPKSSLRGYFAGSWHVLMRDVQFRRLCVVAMLFGTVPILFPHYQALAREQLHLAGRSLMQFVVVQNAALGIFSVAVGAIADFRGNRLALRSLIFSTILAPLAAVTLVHVDPAIGAKSYWIVFVPLGLTPLTMKTLVNYTLEMAPAAEHPRYLATMSLCQALPFCFSPLVGLLLDATSFEVVFTLGAAVILLAGILTYRLIEPRQAGPAGAPGSAH